MALAVSAGLLLSGCGHVAPDRAPAAPPSRSATPTTTPTRTAAPTLDDRAAALVASMSLSERAGQLLMTAGTVGEVRALGPAVRRYHLAGVMVRGRSGAGVAAVRRALRSVRRAAPDGLPLLTSTDQEGGSVQVLTGPGFGAIPSAVRQAERSPSALRRDARSWGGALADAGVRLDLGPVADVPCASTRWDNPPVADLLRNYGTNPTEAGRHVTAFVRGMRDAGVETAVKHFPGLGCVRANTDTAQDVVDRVTTGGGARIRPFRAGIDAGAGFVMVSSAEYARIDQGVPALFSKPVIQGLLRDRLGFDGVVMSDDTGGAAALQRWSPGTRATRFVSAGGDLLLDIVPSHVPALHRALVKKAADPAFEAKLTAAATRVVAARLRLAG